jgi:hypothetical protein
MNIKLNTFGSALGTRSAAESIRMKVEESLKTGNEILIDLEGVFAISNSFSDELFGKLLFSFDIHTLRKLVRIINANEFVSDCIKSSMRIRSSNLDGTSFTTTPPSYS